MLLAPTLFSGLACALVPPALQDSAHLEPAVLGIAVRSDAGLLLAGSYDANGEAPLPIPLLARSDRVPRAVPGPEGIEIELRATCCWPEGVTLDQLRLRAVRHPIDAQVVRTKDGLFLVGPARLPARAWSTGVANVLPDLARLDGRHPFEANVHLEPPAVVAADERLVLLCDRGALQPSAKLALRSLRADESIAPGGPRWFEGGEPKAEILSVDRRDVRAASPMDRLDQLYYAVVKPLDDASAEALRIHRAAWGEDESFATLALAQAADRCLKSAEESTPLRLVFAAPDRAPDGSTYTLLLDVTRAGIPGPRTGGHSHCAAADHVEQGPFHDCAETAGVDFVHMEGPDLQLDIRPTMGPGVAWGDVDGDGWVDLYLVQGGGREGSEVPRDRLFANEADGTFADVTERSGIDERGAGMGALFLDAEGDGDLDLYVANYGRDRLYQNDGRGKFADVTDAAGVAGDRWHAGVAAADTDGDGDLEVYVTSYVDYAKMLPAEELGSYQREDPLAMLPFAFPGQANTFYVNESAHGAIRLRDATDELGLADAGGRGMQPIFWDFDRDGDQDLYVANDVSPNQLFRNEGVGKFKNVSFGSGIDDPRGCMGLAVADVDSDLDADVFVTNWQLEANALYVNHLVSSSSRKLRVGTFHDEIVPRGLGPDGIGVTKWGCEFFDWDLDGDQDLFYANGYTSPDYESTGICVAQPCHFFLNDGGGRFARSAAATDGERRALDRKLAHRAVAACDYDQDGRVELAITSNNGPFRLLKPRAIAPGEGRHWLGVRLRGRGANTHAIGAEVTLRAGERTQRRWLQAGTSYLAGNPAEIHFGLGAAAKVDELVVRWPNGRESAHAVAGIDRFAVLTEPE